MYTSHVLIYAPPPAPKTSSTASNDLKWTWHGFLGTLQEKAPKQECVVLLNKHRLALFSVPWTTSWSDQRLRRVNDRTSTQLCSQAFFSSLDSQRGTLSQAEGRWAMTTENRTGKYAMLDPGTNCQPVFTCKTFSLPILIPQKGYYGQTNVAE